MEKRLSRRNLMSTGLGLAAALITGCSINDENKVQEKEIPYPKKPGYERVLLFNLKEAKDQKQAQRIIKKETRKVEKDPYYRSLYIDDYVYIPLDCPDLSVIQNWNANSLIGTYVPPEVVDGNDLK